MLKLKNGNHCQKPIKTHQFSWRPDEYPAAPWPSSSLIHMAKFKLHILKPTCLNESKIDQVTRFNCLILSCKRPVAKLSRSSFTWESRIKSWNSSKLSNSHRLILPLSPLPHPPVERCVHDSFAPLPWPIHHSLPGVTALRVKSTQAQHHLKYMSRVVSTNVSKHVKTPEILLKLSDLIFQISAGLLQHLKQSEFLREKNFWILLSGDFVFETYPSTFHSHAKITKADMNPLNTVGNWHKTQLSHLALRSNA